MPKKKHSLVEPPIPKDLQLTQDWFASIITRPISPDSEMEMTSPSGRPMEVEAAKYIAPSPTMQPHRRIELYNQQYWWRLLTVMHETFPLVTRLFGYYEFNQEIAIPYLQKYPPKDWSLVHLGKDLPIWIQEEYTAKDKKLVHDAANLDWAFNEAFIIGELPPLNLANLPNSDNPDSLLTTPLYLQPHINLFTWNCDLFVFRNAFLDKDPDFWLDNDFPKLPKGKPLFFVLYRDGQLNIQWKEISSAEYHLLALYKKGATIESACHYLENQKDRKIYEEATKNLQLWFQEWSMKGWLSLEIRL